MLRSLLVASAFCLLLAIGVGAQSPPPPADDAARSQALYLKGRALFREGQHAAAREALVEAIRVVPATNPVLLGNIQHELGWVLFEIEGQDAARQVWLSGIESMARAGDKRGENRIRLSLMFLMNSGPQRLKAIEDGLAQARALQDGQLEAGWLDRLGNQHMLDGRYLDAIVSLREAAAAFKAQGRTGNVVRTLQLLNRLYRKHGRSDLARETLLEAARLIGSAAEPGARAMKLALLASSESAVGNTALAIAHQQKAVAASRLTDSRRTTDQLELVLAMYYVHAGQATKAVAILQRLLAEGDPFVARIASDPLSVAYLESRRYREAIDAANRALAQTLEPSGTPWIYETRARARRALGHREQALADATEALGRIEGMRATLVPADAMKQGFAEMTQDLFDLAIGLHADVGQPLEALSVAEQARSRAFLDLLASRRDRDALAALDAERTAAMPALGEIPSIERATPFSAADYSALAARLDSTVIVYWVGSKESLVWAVAPHGAVTMNRIAATRVGLQKLVAGTIPAPRAGTRAAQTPAGPLPTAVLDVATRKANWRTLHQLLIDPIAGLLPRDTGARLTIVPHGPLVQLSFAALKDAGGRYLLERYAIHYLPAGAALLPSTPAGTPTAALIVGAPDRFPAIADVRLEPLPGAAAEARSIARYYGAGSALVISGASAGERAVREHLERAGVLHFATHAVTLTDAPLEGFLALRPGTGAPDDNGRLTMAEIYQLRLDAELAVLSACRSASGTSGADGVAGFARAFLSAGVRTVVGGLWEVPDLTSAMLMRSFYEQRGRALSERSESKGSPHATALRRAQLGLLRALRAGQVTTGAGDRKAIVPEDPALWAGFIVLGAP